MCIGHKMDCFWVALFQVTNGAFYAALAHHEKGDHHRAKYLTPVSNPMYIEECGACHFAYQPEPLPSGS